MNTGADGPATGGLNLSPAGPLSPLVEARIETPGQNILILSPKGSRIIPSIHRQVNWQYTREDQERR